MHRRRVWCVGPDAMPQMGVLGVDVGFAQSALMMCLTIWEICCLEKGWLMALGSYVTTTTTEISGFCICACG